MRKPLSAAIIAILPGCGGGGGSNIATTPLEQDLQSAPTPSLPFNITETKLTGAANGNSYTEYYGQMPNSGTTTFNGQTANSSTAGITLIENGIPIGGEATTVYYLENPYTPLGLTGTVNGTAFDVIFTSTDPYPSTLTVGDSGPLGSGTYYLAGTNTAIGSLTETYSVTENNAATLLLNVYATGTVNGNAISETLTYTVDASGNVALVASQETVEGIQVTFT